MGFTAHSSFVEEIRALCHLLTQNFSTSLSLAMPWQMSFFMLSHFAVPKSDVFLLTAQNFASSFSSTSLLNRPFFNLYLHIPNTADLQQMILIQLFLSRLILLFQRTILLSSSNCLCRLLCNYACIGSSLLYLV